jgi:hypothetical protein
MSTLRELLAHDISHGCMEQSDTEETGADRIGALARADPLGAALWRVTGNLDVGSFISARGYLVARLRDKFPKHSTSTLGAVAQKAMEEWLACLCEMCGGRKFVVDEETSVRSTCPECRGTGRGRHSDSARMAALKLNNRGYANVVLVFVQAHEFLNAADARVDRQVAYQLERRKPLIRKK